ncbi:MAG: hypothetical protein ACRD0J_12865 [Acidimicrobiales bacterium]
MSAGERIRAGAKRAEASPPPFRRAEGRASYPHRVSLDLNECQYEFLRHAAWEARLSAASLLRGALQMLVEDESALAKALSRAEEPQI